MLVPRVFTGTVPSLTQTHQEPYDFNRYTNFHLEKLLKDAGFTSVVVVPLGARIDTYDTVELKFWDGVPKTPLNRLLRTIRRIEMRLLGKLISLPASHKFTEGYGFCAHIPTES